MAFAKEKFDVVDKCDNVLYTISGKNALHNLSVGRYHRCSHLFMEAPGGRFVIQLKAEGTENAGKWSSAVSGHVRSGETYREAVYRETLEELNLELDLSELDKVSIIHPCEDTGQEFVALFTYLLDDNEVIKPNPDEVKEIRILKLDDLLKNMDANPDIYSPAFKVAMDIFLTQYKV